MDSFQLVIGFVQQLIWPWTQPPTFFLWALYIPNLAQDMRIVGSEIFIVRCYIIFCFHVLLGSPDIVISQ